jgi:hypothetical protein
VSGDLEISSALQEEVLFACKKKLSSWNTMRQLWSTLKTLFSLANGDQNILVLMDVATQILSAFSEGCLLLREFVPSRRSTNMNQCNPHVCLCRRGCDVIN